MMVRSSLRNHRELEQVLQALIISKSAISSFQLLKAQMKRFKNAIKLGKSFKPMKGFSIIRICQLKVMGNMVTIYLNWKVIFSQVQIYRKLRRISPSSKKKTGTPLAKTKFSRLLFQTTSSRNATTIRNYQELRSKKTTSPHKI